MENLFIERVKSSTPELLAAFERLMPQLSQSPIPSARDLQSLLDSASVLLIARPSNQAGLIIGAGTLGVFRTPSGLHAHIEDVIVDQSWRGQGVGEALVTHLLQTAREMGLDGVSLTCNPRRLAANRLYQKMGFKNWETNTYWYEL
jgi:ribosomal protein S18 acetylase RimI-like enzyme